MKKIISILIAMTFLSQNVVLAAPKSRYLLRAPMQFNLSARESIEKLNKKFILSTLEEYIKIERAGTGRTNYQKRDDHIIAEIQKIGRNGIKTLKNILETEERTWMRAKAALVLARLCAGEDKEILDILLERLALDNSSMVRSIIARGSLPEIQKNVLKATSKEIDKKIKLANLDPWPRKNSLQIMDVGCQFGEACHGILGYYKNKGFVDVAVVGLDRDVIAIIEAEKNRKDSDIVFILGDIDKDKFGPVDIIFSMNLLLYEDEMERHAESLAAQLNPDGGAIYYTPSVYGTGVDGVQSAFALERGLKKYLPEKTTIATEYENPFGTDFGSPWKSGVAWVTATLPPEIAIETERNEAVKLKTRYFPDGELYLRILNPDEVNGSSLTVTSPLDSSEDLVKIVLLMDLLKTKGAREIKLVLDKPYDIKNGLDKLLRFYCDKLSYKDGRAIVEYASNSLEPIEKKKSPLWIDRVLYEHRRLASDAQEAASSIEAIAERLIIKRPNNNPLSWSVSINKGLKGENVILVHSAENFNDFAELWLMLIALRQAGVNSVSLIDTYEGYSRQDKEFNPGEAVSALTMLKTLDALVDNHMALNVHYADKSGKVKFGKYELYNLNAFIQPAENLFNRIVQWAKEEGKSLADELNRHPMLLVGPDDGAFGYVQEAADVLKKYIKKKFGIDVEMHVGYTDKKRLSDTEVIITGKVLGQDGQPLAGVSDIKNCWVIILDDETAWGTTLLAVTYALVREAGIPWHRILAGVVHGKLARGIGPFITGHTEEEILKAIKDGREIAPTKKHIKEIKGKGRMPPRLFVTTKSVALPREFPQAQSVSIGPIIAYAAKNIVGKKPMAAKLESRKLADQI